MDNITFDHVLTILQAEAGNWHAPVITLVSERSKDPYQILISTLLSLRTKDETTIQSAKKLFAAADTPKKMLSLSAEKIRGLIYPAGFYKVKAENILKISSIIIEQHSGNVPDTMEGLLSLPGVGRKTANLVITLGFGKPGICVDTHVHRITNRLGYVTTKTPDETEWALREKMPAKWWIPASEILVAFGQTVCRPVSPFCTRCAVEKWCKRKGVTHSR
jgi:endonuclease III